MEYILKASGIQKSFGNVHALDDLHLEIGQGEIHCLAGENGCGKSTIIKIISGVYTPDGGTLELNGKTYTKLTPIEAINNGVQVIYQDFSVFPNLTVLENIAYNSELAGKRKLVNWQRMKETAQEALKKINLDIDLFRLVEDLSVAEKQLVAISRALLHNAKLIIMDEPTSALTRKEVSALFRIVSDLKKQGISILFVSHKLDEVFEICENITILRNGKNVFQGAVSELDEKKFSFYMTGREIQDEKFVPQNLSEEPLLEVKGLTLPDAFYDVNFSLRRGEILGISGLLGSGRTELALALFGMLQPQSGEIRLNGEIRHLRSVQDAMEAGIGYVPEDRLTEGLFLERSIESNITVSSLQALGNRMGVVDKKRYEEMVEQWVKMLSIATKDPMNAANTLSGGNQQRIVLAKWLARDPSVLILNGPTAGVDIGSKYDIHHILREFAKKGMGIIIISDDIPEVITNCSRILIMREGRITDEVDGAQADENWISERMIAETEEKGGGSHEVSD